MNIDRNRFGACQNIITIILMLRCMFLSVPVKNDCLLLRERPIFILVPLKKDIPGAFYTRHDDRAHTAIMNSIIE